MLQVRISFWYMATKWPVCLTHWDTTWFYLIKKPHKLSQFDCYVPQNYSKDSVYVSYLCSYIGIPQPSEHATALNINTEPSYSSCSVQK